MCQLGSIKRRVNQKVLIMAVIWVRWNLKQSQGHLRDQKCRIKCIFCHFPQAKVVEPLRTLVYSLMLGTKVDMKLVSQNWLKSLNSTNIYAYSDRSSEKPGYSSWRYVLQLRGTTFQKEIGILHSGIVYDVDSSSAFVALRADMSVRLKSEKFLVLLDNKATVLALQSRKSSSSLRLTYLSHFL